MPRGYIWRSGVVSFWELHYALNVECFLFALVFRAFLERLYPLFYYTHIYN
jgi:hypothetical protein